MDNEQYIFFLDIDGTILHRGEISKADRDAIFRVRQAGHKVILNTGRPLFGISDDLKKLVPDGWVSNLGTCVIVDGKYLFTETVPLCEWIELFRDFTEKGYHFYIESDDLAVYNPNMKVMDRPNTLETIEQLSERYPNEPFRKGVLIDRLPDAEREKLSERYSFCQHEHFAEFCSKGCSKAKGMQVVLDYYGIPKERCIAIGDSLNDLEMLLAAGISVAMGNAVEEVKKSCDFVTRSVEAGGVAYVMERVLNHTFSF